MKQIQIVKSMTFVTLTLLVLLMTSITVTAVGDKVYLAPSTSSAEYCTTVDVEIWADATNFQSGQVELTYNPGCAEVTNFVRDSEFEMGTWDSSTDGREWITFTNVEGVLNGNYLVGTLTIHCLSEVACSTDLVIDNADSKLFNDVGGDVPSVDWMNGGFSCEASSSEPAGEVYLNPSTSSAEYCTTVDVEIWADATNFQSGQIELTYNPGCAEVTNFVRDSEFEMGTWDSSTDGREWITFTNEEGVLNGNYLVGTLTIHCLSEEACSTDLVIDNADSKLFNDVGGEVSVTWTDGSFSCDASSPEPSGKEDEVYFDPSAIGADYCNTMDVDIRVNTTDFQGGQIELTYNPGCAEVTNFVRGSEFEMGTWDSSTDGREWITFTNVEGTLTGDYLIGTFTIHCLSEEVCSTDLVIDNADSKLFNDVGDEVSVSWTDGSFSCNLISANRIDLSPGWNFFSVPCALENGSTEYVLDGVDYDAIWWYNTCCDSWHIPSDIVPLTAYWIHVNTSETIENVECGYSTPLSRQLYAGWNPIGLTGIGPRTAEFTLGTGWYNNNIDDYYTIVKGPYDPATGYTQYGFNLNAWTFDPLDGTETSPYFYTTNYMMDRYEGHWVYLTSDAMLYASG